MFFLTPEQHHPQRGEHYRDLFYARSKKNGRFASPPLPNGEYRISAGRPHSEGLLSESSVKLIEFERRDAVVVIGDSCLLRIAPNETLGQEYSLTLEEKDLEERRRNPRRASGREKDPWEKSLRIRRDDANEDGGFVVSHLRAGEYRLVVEAGRQKYLIGSPFILQAGEPVTIRFDGPPSVEKISEEMRAERKRLRKLGIQPERDPEHLPWQASIVVPDFESNFSKKVGVFWH